MATTSNKKISWFQRLTFFLDRKDVNILASIIMIIGCLQLYFLAPRNSENIVSFTWSFHYLIGSLFLYVGVIVVFSSLFAHILINIQDRFWDWKLKKQKE